MATGSGMTPFKQHNRRRLLEGYDPSWWVRWPGKGHCEADIAASIVERLMVFVVL